MEKLQIKPHNHKINHHDDTDAIEEVDESDIKELKAPSDWKGYKAAGKSDGH
jgi:hypothetical protein